MAWTNLLYVMENRGNPQDKVAAEAGAWLKACPDSLEAHQAYQDQQVALGHRAEVLAEYRARLDAHPDEGASHYLYARLMSDPEQSAPHYREAVQRAPGLWWAQEGLAHDLLTLEQDAAAMELLEKAVQTTGHDSALDPVYAMAAIGAGAAGQADQVLETLEKQQKEEDEDLWQARWLLSLALGRYDAAEVRLREYTQRTGESPANWMRRVQSLRLRGDNAGLTRAIMEGRLKPETAHSAGLLRMEQALAQSKWAEAVQAIDELKPDEVSAVERLYAAIALLQAGERKAAGERLSALDAELSQSAGNDDNSAASLAMTRYLEGKAPAAAMLASARRAGFQMLPHASFVLASAREAAGDLAGARALYEKSRQRALAFELPYFAAAARAKG
jgi:hypothetical protein